MASDFAKKTPSHGTQVLSSGAPASGSMRRSAPAELLLSIALEAPVTEGTRATAIFLVEQLSRLFPELAIGIRLERDGGEVWIERHVPAGFSDCVSGNPDAVFEHLPGERIFELDDAGSTLHFVDAGPPARAKLEPSAEEPPALLLAARTARRCLALSRIELGRVIEERDRLRARIVQIEKLASLGQMTASIAHELGNPLTAIVADSDYLRRRALERSAAGEPAAEELRSSERLADSATRVLRFSRDIMAHARPSSEVPERLSLRTVLERAIYFCEHELTRHAVRLDEHVDESLPAVFGVSSQLVQVFVNLITNAAHAAAGGGHRVSVRTRVEDKWVVALVCDDGAGIAPENMDRIFEPFFSTKPYGQGAGLGLSIVRDIVDRHGGVLSVETRPENGASFSVRLPVLS